MGLALRHRLQKRVINPPIRGLVRLGVVPPGCAVLETTGRRSGLPRLTVLGDGLVGDRFWIVCEHGRRSDYVRNIEAEARVRVKVRQGLRSVWRSGVGHVLDDDDTRARQRALASGHPLRRANAAAVRGMGTELLTVRIDLD